jgi:hypothetical protein
MQKTSSLWSCGSAWPSLTAFVGGATASSRPTELVKLWSNLPAATASPLQRYCHLPEGFAVAAVAAGSSHIVLLSAAGGVIDTRAAAAAADVDGSPAAAAAAAEPAEQPNLGPAAAGGLQQEVVHAAVDDDGGDVVELEGLQQQQQQQQLGVLQLSNPWRPLGTAVASIAAGDCLFVLCCIESYANVGPCFVACLHCKCQGWIPGTEQEFIVNC